MPAPPARSLSAKVPWGTNSTSSSPDRNWRSNSLFSPTYDPVVRRIRLAPSSRPRPHPSTPQLLLTVSRSVASLARSASMRAVGMPHSPKPPTANDEPLRMSCTACSAVSTTLSIYTPITLANIGLLILVASFEGKLPYSRDEANARTVRDGLGRPSRLAIHRLVRQSASKSTPVAISSPCNCHTKSSVARLPVALPAYGHPPSPPADESTVVTPFSRATRVLASPWPYVS